MSLPSASDALPAVKALGALVPIQDHAGQAADIDRVARRVQEGGLLADLLLRGGAKVHLLADEV